MAELSASSPGTELSSFPDGIPLSHKEKLKAKIVKFQICFKHLWNEIQRFGSWVEYEISDLAKKEHAETLNITIPNDDSVPEVRLGFRVLKSIDFQYERLMTFFKTCQIQQLAIDVRLERNQIEDVLTYLYAHQTAISLRSESEDKKRQVGVLHPDGLHIACTKTKITQNKLSITYSYCTLQFSKMVHWFENSHKNFRDHRSLFQAAPKYALLLGVIASGPLMIHGINYENWFVFFMALFGGMVVVGLIYLFFMVVGSIEYDNEEKAYHLNRAYSELKTYNDRMQADIQRAKHVQENILPNFKKMPMRDKIDWACSFRPEEAVGGDYFDVAKIAKDKIAILFCDVSGHGMAAAFITAIVKTTFQSWIESNRTLEELVQELNQSLYRLTPPESFAAIFVANYDAESKEFTYINAGHNPEPWRIQSESNQITSFQDSRTLILGITDDIDCEAKSQKLDSGDKILFASDGIIEAHDVDHNYYSTEALQEFLEKNHDLSMHELVNAIVEEITGFSKHVPQGDDQTILAFQIK